MRGCSGDGGQTPVVEKMKAEQSKFIASLNSEANGEADATKSDQKVSISEFDHVPEDSAPICSLCWGSDSGSPLRFLIFLQKSRLTSLVERGLISWDDADNPDKEMRPNANKGVIESSCDASRSPVRLVQSASVDVSYGIESADMYAFQGLFGEWLPETRDTQACASSTSSQLTLEMLKNDAYQSIIGEICSTEYRSYAPNGDLNCLTAQVALGSQQSKSEESRV